MADGSKAQSTPSQEGVLRKFQHPDFTADGAPRAQVEFAGLETLWVNTGTLCNVECAHCYIESSPTNDRLVYLSKNELAPILDEASQVSAREIGFTGGEPFMNPDILAMVGDALARGFEVLILTNAMRPMMRTNIKEGLLGLQRDYADRLTLRVSLDHFTKARHDKERGAGSFEAGLCGLRWLAENDFSISVAGRTLWGEAENKLREGFAALFHEYHIHLDAHDHADLVLFPEMDETASVPEITTDCWETLGKNPQEMMCASSRMIVKRKGANTPVVLSCTLLAYDTAFEMGQTLGGATRPVKLNHPHCAKFCVLGGASCSG